MISEITSPVRRLHAASGSKGSVVTPMLPPVAGAKSRNSAVVVRLASWLATAMPK